MTFHKSPSRAGAARHRLPSHPEDPQTCPTRPHARNELFYSSIRYLDRPHTANTAVRTSNHRKQAHHTTYVQNTGGQRQLFMTLSQTLQPIPSRNRLAEERPNSSSHTRNAHATTNTIAPRPRRTLRSTGRGAVCCRSGAADIEFCPRTSGRAALARAAPHVVNDLGAVRTGRWASRRCQRDATRGRALSAEMI